MVKLPVTLHKNQIPETALLRGCANASARTIDGVEHMPLTLRLLGFVGTPVGDQRWSGAYRFEVGAWIEGMDDVALFNWNDLPGMSPDTEEYANGVHPQDST